jgi:uncharacterized protein YbaR (Trm112 family)
MKRMTEKTSLVTITIIIGILIIGAIGYYSWTDSRPVDYLPASAGGVARLGSGVINQKPVAPGDIKSILGFDVTYSLVPVLDIKRGGPPKDGIPALTEPEVISAADAGYIQDNDMVIGVRIGNEARAYPISILNYHENVNDILGDKHIAVTYCPLCNSALVFDREVGGHVREFGISGLLWNSNVLMFDRGRIPEEESLWSQILMKAVTGPAARQGLEFELLSSEYTSWAEWLGENPETTALSMNTGHKRMYAGSPYASYFTNDRLMFPVKQPENSLDGRFVNKEQMILLKVNDRMKAYAVKDIAKAARETGYIEDRIGEKRLRLNYTAADGSVEAVCLDDGGMKVPTANLFWFVLNAMHPDIDVYSPKKV